MSSLPTIRWVRDNVHVSVGNVLEAPERYLTGPPRDFWEK
jgi:hypothetical protein